MKHPQPKGWLKSRLAIALAVVLLLAVVLAAYANGGTQPLLDRSQTALRSEDKYNSPRAYQFSGQGKIQGGSGSTWMIGGVPLSVSEQTNISGVLHPGDPVAAFGHILEDGVWLAERIDLINENETFFSFAGPLQSQGETFWEIGGFSLQVNDSAEVEPQLEIGALVLVTFIVEKDGTWQALVIKSLTESPVEASPTPTLTITPSPPPANPTSPPAKEAPAPKTAPSDKKSGDSGTVTICHKPGKKGKTMQVDRSALSGHLGHGDYIGACR